MSGRQSPMYALSSSGRSTPLTLDQEMQLGVASWSRGPPEPPLSSSRDDQDREGVHGGTGLYAYSITSNKKKVKGKAWRPTSAIKTITSPLGRATRGPPPPGLPSHAGAHYYNQRPDSYGAASQCCRPASSVYSQPSPQAAVLAAQQLRRDHSHGLYHQRDPLEISPPSSPDIASPRDGYARDVSPIDEPDDMAQAGAHAYGATPPRGAESRSNIPTMRRERRKNSDAARFALREKVSHERLQQQQHQQQYQHQQRPHDHTVRWDPRTGEPTGPEKGRKSQVNPQAYASDLTSRDVHGTPPRPGPPPQQRDPYGPRVNRRAGSATPEHERQTPPRPVWQGGSGRMTIADPLHDANNVAPLVIPPRNRPPPEGRGSPSAVRGGTRVLSPIQSMNSSGKSTPTGAPSASRGWPGATASPSTHAPSSHYPSPPPEGSHAPPARSAPFSRQQLQSQPPQQSQPRLQSPPPQQAQQRQSSLPLQGHASDVRNTLNVPSAEKAIRRKPAAGPGHRSQPSWSSSVYSDASQPQTPAAPVQQQPAPAAQSQTHAPYSYGTQSQTEHAADIKQPPPSASSVLDRKRPIVAGYEGQGPRSPPIDNVVRIDMSSPFQRDAPSSAGARVPSNKPLAKHGGLFGGGANASVTSLSSEYKCLPPAPPEDEAKDRVAQLNAKLSSLGNRRININTAIKQMTELMPTDNVLASDAVVRKRELEKRKVENLKVELAEVDRESYELGLKLHRAYKRLDRDAEYEPTTLWVRRVTN